MVIMYCGSVYEYDSKIKYVPIHIKVRLIFLFYNMIQVKFCIISTGNHFQ